MGKHKKHVTKCDKKGHKVSQKVKAKSRKVKLPTDRTGEPIHIGDVLQWEDGTRFQVACMTYFGDGMWTAEGEDGAEYSDNLGAAIIMWRGKR